MIRDIMTHFVAAYNGKRGRLAGIGAFLILLTYMQGCSPAVYSVNMRYEPTKAVHPTQSDGRRYGVTVASFIDQRKIDDTLVIGHVIASDGTPIPVLPKYVKPIDAVTGALRGLLIKLGYTISPDKPSWDLKETTIRPEWGTILIGGTIDELDVTCLDNLTIKRYSAKARVTLIFAGVQKKRIFYKVTAESSSSLDHIVFSEEMLESQINSVLSATMEKALEGPEAIRRIREELNK